ncbi:MAG: DNA-invertase hin [Nitrospira sp.]|nr:DNA-invertase hin [Nitrospira sp.]
MTKKSEKVLRCAVYTRKSTEHGLELEFNSLDAQREACEAFVKSQASEGWRLLSRRYDDPAYSGGNMERPALQQLLKDIEAGQIDVIVVYKIDRLTRSLADFAKLVEIFDTKSVSFVAVTQQFNTTTSMGRLTLNVLLSFAQFERELASERVRDKVAASRRKGKWTGGSIPLGYDSKDKRLIINPNEAKTVRIIFARYLALKSLLKVVDELNSKGIVTKKRGNSERQPGGAPFTYGSLAYLLKNRTYLGQTGYGGSWFAGEHEPILDQDTFEQVQALMKDHTIARIGRRHRTNSLLSGLIFDDRGNRMSPSFTVKKRVRYPFYVSSAVLRGKKAQIGSVTRVSAIAIEQAVLRALRDHVDEASANLLPHELIERCVARVVVEKKRVVLTARALEEGVGSPLVIPWTGETKRYMPRIDESEVGQTVRSSDPELVHAIVRARAWLTTLDDGTYDSVEALAQAVGLHPKVVRNRIRLAFLAPALTREFLNGRRPATANLNEVCLSMESSWSKQRERLLQ